MIALEINNIKEFMNHLLKENTFDHFETLSVDLTTIINVKIDGTINNNYFDTKEKELNTFQKYITWQSLKPTLYNMLKGNKVPLSLKICLSLSDKSMLALIKNSGTSINENIINGFIINIIFENKSLKIITGTNYKIFTKDKSVEFYFDDSIKKFLTKNNIIFNTIE